MKMSSTNNLREHYDVPRISIFEVSVEQGFAVSSGETENADDEDMDVVEPEW